MAEGTNPSWVLLLRGINVGKSGRMAMADLRACLADAGFENVATYIQSGNVVLDATSGADATSIRDAVSSAIGDTFGFVPPVHVLTVETMRAAVAESPFSDAGDVDPKAVHYYFGADLPDEPQVDVLRGLAADDERVTAGAAAVHLHTPSGLARSKLARALGDLGDLTARNHRSVLAIIELADGR